MAVRPAGPGEETAAVGSSGTACPACGSGRSNSVFVVSGWTFRRCRTCSTLYAVDPPEGGETAGLYEDESYYRNAEYERSDFRGYRDYMADRAAIEAKFDALLARVERHVSPGELLDVGAGPGLMLAAAERRGWRARGLDLNPWAVEEARRSVGVEVELGTLEGAGGDRPVDLLAAMDLIEHVPSPSEWVQAAAETVRPGGGLVLLTPDAGSWTTRLLGRRWPEVQRVPEHLVLFSVPGLSELLQRHGFEPLSWHSIGKTTSLATLAADLRPLAPRVTAPLASAVRRLPGAGRQVHFDPRAKFCIYAIRARGRSTPSRSPQRTPVRAPLREEADVAHAIREDLEHLAAAKRLGDWTFEELIRNGDAGSLGAVAEVGAGIGNFSRRLLDAGADRLVLIEPEASCAAELERVFATDPRVQIARESVPGAASLAPGSFDLIVCQNVLEHVDDDVEALGSMARALKPGGRLALLVPAEPGLFCSLDLTYGHLRRYEREGLRRRIEGAGLVIDRLEHFNLLGVLGWRLAGMRRRRPRVGRLSMSAYEALVAGWRPLEGLIRPSYGLSLLCVAHAPGADG